MSMLLSRAILRSGCVSRSAYAAPHLCVSSRSKLSTVASNASVAVAAKHSINGILRQCTQQTRLLNHPKWTRLAAAKAKENGNYRVVYQASTSMSTTPIQPRKHRFESSWTKLACMIALVGGMLVASHGYCEQHSKAESSQMSVKSGSVVVTTAQEHPYSDYFQLLKDYPTTLGPLGDYQKGEIQIETDPVKMAAIGKSQNREVGVVLRDKYWIVLNDAVIFPNGKTGVYGRLLWVNSLHGPAGVAVLPVLPDGKIALNLNFRHATRSWEYELPRGCINKGEQPYDAAVREAREETGMELADVQFVGMMAPDSGLTNTIVPVFIAKVVAKNQAAPEDSEAISDIVAFTVDEIREGYHKGYLMGKVDGKEAPVSIKDPFLTFALFQASSGK